MKQQVVGFNDLYEKINTALRGDLKAFVKYSFSYLRPGEEYSHGWHLDCIAEYLQAVKSGQIKRLIVNMPPRMMKSITCSVAFPAWLIGNEPTTSIICASYAQSLSNQHSLDCRSIMESDWYKVAFPNTRLAKDQNEKSKYKTTQNGMRFATSVGGTLTGAGGSCFPAGTLVQTNKGEIPIEEISNNIENYKVVSYCHTYKQEELKAVIASRRIKKKGLYEILTSDGISLKCTGDHKIYTRENGYVEAEKLKPWQQLHYYGEDCNGFVASVQKTSSEEHEVYDIQVDGNHNFFAENILVHNCIIVDDPLDPNRAASDVERDNANNWMASTVPSRLNNPEKDSIIVVMQRLHENDTSGFLLDKGGWEHLCLPAKNDRKKTIQINGFKKVFDDGELLHPTRLPNKVLDDLEHDLGSYAYAGQYLQRPVPKGGGILQASWWNEWVTKALPPCDYILQVYDTAYKTGTQNDYSARTTWGIFLYKNKPNIILLEAMNLRLTLPDLKREAVESYNEYDPDIVLIEDKASGISLIQELKRTGMRLKAMKRNAGDDKISRAHIASVMLEQGVVWYPKDCVWANEVIRQCANFPNAKHDDLTDTVTDALIFLRHYKKVEVENDGVVSSGSSTFKPNYGGHYG